MASQEIVIIGAGLAGLCLALSLQQKSIPCRVYESRPKGIKVGGAVMLSPNALRVLNSVGVYTRIVPRGFHFEELAMKNDENISIGKYFFGSEEKYGYKGLRIYRQELLAELTAAAEEAGVKVHYERKYQGVISEDESSVVIELDGGEQVTTPLLIGTDGIHSRIRSYLFPNSEASFLGAIAVAGAVKTKDVHVPYEDYTFPVSIFGGPGVFVLAPQDIDGSELMAGTQFTLPEPTREERQAMSRNPQKMLEMIRRDRAAWSPMVQSALDHMIPETMYIWPFYAVPKLDSWMSPRKRVLVIGDAAHALPPTIGQGANQAMEEALSLSLLLERFPISTSTSTTAFARAMDTWAAHRVQRIAQLMEMTRKMNNNRLPALERDRLPPTDLWAPDAANPGEEMRWLYEYDVYDSMAALGL